MRWDELVELTRNNPTIGFYMSVVRYYDIMVKSYYERFCAINRIEINVLSLVHVNHTHNFLIVQFLALFQFFGIAYVFISL